MGPFWFRFICIDHLVKYVWHFTFLKLFNQTASFVSIWIEYDWVKGHYPDFTRRLDHHITTKEFSATGTNVRNTLTQRADGKITRRTKCNFSLVTRLKSSPIEWWHPGIHSSGRRSALKDSHLNGECVCHLNLVSVSLGYCRLEKQKKKPCMRFLSQKHTSFP